MLGAVEAGLGDLLACGRGQEAMGCRNPAMIAWRSSAALTLVLLGQRERALELADEEVALAHAFGAPRSLGVALRAKALVEGGERGISLLSEAVQVLETSSAVLERARALVDLGAALRRAGRKVLGPEHLRLGLDLAYRCGAVVLAERARRELRAAGARPRGRRTPVSTRSPRVSAGYASSSPAG
jgi:hypothetical protein